MFQLLLQQLFSWLPFPLWLGVWAVISVCTFVLIVKLLIIIFYFIFHFIDIFT